jgi:AraC-like DNA-binding protein
VVRPFAQLLKEIGVPVERMFQQAGLPYHALEDVNNYLPSHRFWKFLVTAAYSEGIGDLGFRVGQQFGADSADPQLTELLARSLTLYQGLLKASEIVNRTVSHCRLGILQPPGCSHAYFYHQPSCDHDNPAVEQIGWYGVTVLLGIVRIYAGAQWQPDEIGVMTDQSPGHYICEQFPHTRIRLAQKYSYITLNNSLFALPPLSAVPLKPEPLSLDGLSLDNLSLDYESLPESFASSLEDVLLSYTEESDLNMAFAAELCNTSKRTLQRKLKGMGTSYIEIRNRARFRAARRLLHNPEMKIGDVAHRLGYSDVAHFARAFQRTAGVNPSAYRHQHLC